MPNVYFIPGRGFGQFDDNVTLEQALAMEGVAAPAPAQTGGSDFIDDIQRGVGATASGIGSALRDTRFSDFGQSMQDWGNKVVRNNPADYNSWRDINGVGSALGFVGEKFAENALNLAGALGISALGSPAAGVGFLGATTFAQQYGDTRQAQRDQGIEDKTRAALTALPAAALDVLTGGEARVLRQFGKSAAKEAAEQTAKKSFFRETGKSALEEGLTEPVQQALQRYGSYQDLTSGEAFDEYLTSALAGAAVGGVTAGGLYPFRPAPKQPVSDDKPTDLLKRETQPDLFGGDDVTYGASAPKPSELFASLQGERSRLTRNMAEAEKAGDAAKFYQLQDAVMQIDEQLKDPALQQLARGAQRDAAYAADQPNLFRNPPKEPLLGLPSPDMVNPNPPIYVDSAGNAGPSPDLRGARLMMSPEGSQGNLFNLEPDLPGSDVRTDEGGQVPVQLAGAGQPTLFGAAPTAGVRTAFGQRDILMRLRQAADFRGTKGKQGTPKETTGGFAMKSDSYTLSLANKLSKLLSQGDAFEANRFLDQQEEGLQTGNLTAKTLDQRIPVLQAARQVVEDYNRQLTDAYAQEARMREPQPGAQVSNDAPAEFVRQQVERQQQAEAEAQQRAATEQQQADQARVDTVRTEQLRDIIDHSAPNRVVQDFLKFVASGKGEYGEVGLRENERAMLDEARQIRRKRAEVKDAFARDEAQRNQQKQRQAEGEGRRQRMEQDYAKARSEREMERRAARTARERDVASIEQAPVAEEVPTLDQLMERAGQPEARTPTVLDRIDGPQPTVVTRAEPEPEPTPPKPTKKKPAPKKETTADKIKRAVAERNKQTREKAKPKAEAKAEPEAAAQDDEITYEKVLEEAESYLADDGESGALKPKQYQQLTILAEQQAVTPQRLKELLDKALDASARKFMETGGDSFSTADTNVSRRGFLKGAAATAAVAASPKALARTTIEPTGDLMQALRSGDVQGALKIVARNGSSPILKKVAGIMLRHGVGDIKIRILNPDNDLDAVLNELDKAGVSAKGMRAVAEGGVLGLVSVKGNDQALYLFERAGKNNGLTEQTFMHELIHAYVKARWFKISVYANKNNETLLDEAGVLDERVSEAMQRFVDLWSSVGDRIIQSFKEETDGDFYSVDIEAASKPDEMLSYVLEHPRVQATLKRLFRDANGDWQFRDPAKAKGQPSMWDRIVAFFRDIFNITSEERSAFDELLDAGYAVLEAGEFTNPDFAVAKMVQETNSKGEQNSVAVEKAVNKLPESLRPSVFAITDELGNALRKGMTMAAFTEDLADMARKLIPASKDYTRLMMDKVVEREKLDRAINEIAERFQNLPVRFQNLGKGTVNGFIQDMDDAGVWAFKPTWLDAEGVKYEYDPNSELAEKFKGLPKAAQDVIRDMFEQNFKLLRLKKAAAEESIGGTYKELIAAAEARNDVTEVEQLKADRKEALAEVARLLAIQENKPYASRRRYGNFIVVGKSKALKDAISTGAPQKEIEALKADEDHYYVQRFETIREAKAEERKLAAEGRYDTLLTREADKVADELVGGKEMMLAFQRLRDYIKAQARTSGANDRVLAGINKLAADLYIGALKSTSARKSEQRRLGVAGGDMDMMRNFVTQGRADAHFIGAMKYNEDILDAMSRMRREAGDDENENPQLAMGIYNEMMLRHIAGMNYVPSRLADNIKNATSAYMLTTNISYYLQNLTQPWVLSLPYIAGKHGHRLSTSTLFDAYKQVSKIWGDKLSPLEIEKISDPDTRRAVEDLANMGAIDIGADKDMGEFHSLSKNKASVVWSKVSNALRSATRKTEAINRVATAITAYQLERKAGATHEQAVAYAYRVNRLTNGSYDGFNAPRFMRGPVGSVVTQFKKFQLMQLTLLTRLMHQSLKATDPVERAVARRALAFTMTHTAVLAGGLGMPGMSAIVWALNSLLGDDDEPADIENSIRKAIGDETIANLLLKGVPTLGGMDLSSRIGMGQALSLIPYVEPELNREGYEKTFTALAGPFAGGLMPKMVDGLGLMRDGKFYQGLAQMLPNGLGNGIRTFVEASEGVRKRNGDVLLTPEEIDFGQSIARFMGVQTTEVAERQRRTTRQTNVEQFYKDATADLNQRFAEARENGDSAEMAAVRREWNKLQDARVRNGLKRQPITGLVRYAREKQRRENATVRGVQYRPKSPAYFEAMAEEE